MPPVLPTAPSSPRATGAWIPRGEKDEATFRRVVEAATDFAWLKPGDRVLVKLALNSPHPYPSTTDPWAVACMVRLLAARGAVVYVGDQSGVEWVLPTRAATRGASRDCCDHAGILRAITDAGGKPVFFEEAGYDAYIEAPPPAGSTWTKPPVVTSFVTQVDHIVYLPRIASHAVGAATLGLKLGVGFLREDSRYDFHMSGPDFMARYAEIHEIPAIQDRLRLIVSSGTEVLTTIGPDIGHVARPDAGLLLASTDLVAHEVLALAWLHCCRDRFTPAGARAADRVVFGNRSSIHRSWVRKTWATERWMTVPDVPDYSQARRRIDDPIWTHPALVHWMARNGGRPAGIDFEAVAGTVDPGVDDWIRSHLDPRA